MLHAPAPLPTRESWRHELAATLRLAWPLVLTNLTMSLIGATDVLMIGWLGPTELAASSLGFNFAMLLSIFGMGLVTAVSPMMASEIGRRANSVRDIRRTFRQALWLTAAISVPMMVVLWHTGTALRLLGQDAELAALAERYLRAYQWSIPLFLCTLVLLVLMIRRPEGDTIFADKEVAGEDADAPYGLWGTLAWFAGLIAATWFVGFILALVGFLVTFLRVRAGAGWVKTLVLTAAGIGFMMLMAAALNRDFPPGLLQGAVDLPWPLK